MTVTVQRGHTYYLCATLDHANPDAPPTTGAFSFGWVSHGASIEGVVSAPDGSPLEGVTVTALRQTPYNEWAPQATAVTDSEGHYAFWGLPIASFKLDFERTWPISTGTITQHAYWNGKGTLATADALWTTVDSTIRADLVFGPPYSTLDGTVAVDGTEAPAVGMRVNAYTGARPPGGSLAFASTALVDSGGAFSLPNIIQGETYYLQFTDEGRGHFVDEWFRDVIQPDWSEQVFIGPDGALLTAHVASAAPPEHDRAVDHGCAQLPRRRR